MTETIGNFPPSANTLGYYEESACFHMSDREFIIENGLWEWLLTAAASRVTGIAMVKPPIVAGGIGGITEYPQSKMRACRKNSLSPGHNANELVILVANLIGGAVK